MKKADKTGGHRRSPMILLLTGVFCLTVIAAVVGLQILKAQDRILPNVRVGDIQVGNLTPKEAIARLDNAVRAINVAGVNFSYQDKSLTIKADETSLGGGSGPLISYDIYGMARDAFALGHESGTLDLIRSNLMALLTDINLPVKFQADRSGLRQALISRFGGYEHSRRDADIKVVRVKRVSPPPEDSSSTAPVIDYDYQIGAIPEIDGTSFDYDSAIDQAVFGLAAWQGSDVQLELKAEKPPITEDDAGEMRVKAVEALKQGPYSLAYDDKTWPIDAQTLSDALTLKIGPDGRVRLGLRPTVINPIFDGIAKSVETEAKPTKLKVEDGRATEFEGGQLGKTINRKATIDLADARLNDGKSSVINVIVDTYSSPDSDRVAEELGIRELLGYGTSNYAGSPKNRQLNIANGVKLLNGLIFKPGEEAGMLEHLKPFEETNGYYPELVIKGKRTLPEVGGGLCQIGTTAFRAMMGSGLPVTMRQNHSFRVHYYEPAGTDATIYDPAPDLKFLNDTGNSVLLVTKILPRNTLRFEFWGTRDGRVESQSKIKMWDQEPPPEPKLIETSELPEGKQKCFENASPGAKTSFTYTVTYPDGRVAAKEFKSVYKPWQQQCLVGKAGAAHIVLKKDGSLEEIAPADKTASAPAALPPAI